MMYVTTSWDDGSKHDTRLAALLDTYNVRGTFYVPMHFNNLTGKFSEYERRMTEAEIITLSKHHEIGAHGIHHRSLPQLSDDDLSAEISGSKRALEDIVGKSTDVFCYPNGAYNERVIKAVRAAGFAGARTTEKFIFTLPQDPYTIGVSVQIAPFPFRRLNARRLYYRHLFDPLLTYRQYIMDFPSIFLGAINWLTLANRAFEYAYNHGGCFHLYGHSWEIAKYEQWDALEAFLRYMSRRDDIKFITNGEALDMQI